MSCREAADENKPELHKECKGGTHCCCLHRVKQEVEHNGGATR